MAQPTAMPVLRSWTEDAATRHVSAEVAYTKEVEVGAEQLRDARISLDFGVGTPLDTVPKVPAGMRAMLESPIREAAVVMVNGRRAGAVWSPPYTLDVTPFLKPGKNQIEVKVANSALNVRAGAAEPDYRLLSARYGQRFVPQDLQLVVAQPSGLLGPVRLIGEKIQ
jgi:hypothetical protein